MTTVCHITSVHNSDDVRIFHKECATLAKNSYKVYLVAPGKNKKEKNVDVIGAGIMPNKRIERMIKFTRKIYSIAIKVDADIYHVHDPELLPFAAKLKKRGKKVIFDSHEDYSTQIKTKNYLPQWLRGWASFLYKKYETKVCKIIDAVIIPCTISGVNIFEKRSKRTIFIDNYPLIEKTYQKNTYKNNRTCCYVGALSYGRGITHLVKASPQVNGKLKIVGSFNNEEYEHRIKQMPEAQDVEFYGFLNRSEAQKIISQTTVGIATLLNVAQYYKIDNFPTKTLEYMAMGLPVVISDYPFGVKEINRLKCGICVNPENPKEIADAINWLFDHPEEAETMGENGKKAVVEKYNWKTQEKKLLALYESLEQEMIYETNLKISNP
ncbi:glycosyltransferase family 4 protein [Eubacterium limosum]|uniref:glycosyltransferase family 4 protein n=1 Tax=Eubacterium limosum TaxID=1736 RepID=UPI003710682A